MKTILTMTAAILLSTGMALAQTSGGGDAGSGGNGGAGGSGTGQQNSTTNPSQGSDHDPSNYLAGPNIHRFYTDESMGTLRSEAEIRSAWDGMSEADRTNLRQSCAGNADARFTSLCSSVGAM